MGEFLQWVQALGTPVVAFIAFRIWKLETNHLPHIERDLAVIKARIDNHIDQGG